jgi:class 3 adenylate cyclase
MHFLRPFYRKFAGLSRPAYEVRASCLHIGAAGHGIACRGIAAAPPQGNAVEFAMSKRVQVRWIEHAESRSVREHAALYRAASEPHVSVGYAGTGSARFKWLRVLRRPLGRTLAARSPPVERIIPARAFSLAALTIAHADFDAADADADDDRILAAVLITDIVGSTKLVAEMGDRDWRVLLDRHDDVIRRQIKRFGGSEVGNRGDGFVAIFDTPASAVCCATVIAERIAPLGVRLRCGIHFGKVHFKNNKISGITAHIAARIAATAHPGGAFVSKTVRDRVVGSGLVFDDLGIHRLRDVPEEMPLYAVRAIGAPPLTDIVDTEAAGPYEQPWRVHDEHGADFGRMTNGPDRRVRRSRESEAAVSERERAETGLSRRS